MKVTGWTYWDSPLFEELPSEYFDEAWDAVVDEIKNNDYCFTGYSHQNYEYGTPIIDGTYLFQLSMRTWGRLMYEARKDSKEFQDCESGIEYCVWAWISPEDSCVKLPRGEN